jgi:hypothetical protein
LRKYQEENLGEKKEEENGQCRMLHHSAVCYITDLYSRVIPHAITFVMLVNNNRVS